MHLDVFVSTDGFVPRVSRAEADRLMAGCLISIARFHALITKTESKVLASKRCRSGIITKLD